MAPFVLDAPILADVYRRCRAHASNGASFDEVDRARHPAELSVFPNGRHDDQVDSTSQALAWTKQRPPGWGLLEYYRQEAEEARGLVPPLMVRFEAPPGLTHVYTMEGHSLMVHDGHVTVSEQNVQGLIGAGFVRT